MRVVFVGEVVRVNHLRPGRRKDRPQVSGVVAVARFFHGRTGIIELRHERVLGDDGCLTLLLGAHDLHLLVGVVGILVGSRTAGAVGHRHAAEPLLRLLVAGEDAVQRHHLEVILVRADTEMRRPA